MKVQPINTYNYNVKPINNMQQLHTHQKLRDIQPTFKSNAAKTAVRYFAGGLGVAIGGTLGMALEPAMGFMIGIIGWLIGYHGAEAYQEYEEFKNQNNNKTDLK